MVPVQLVQKLDYIGIAVGATEGVACAIKAEDELIRLIIGR